MAPLTRLVQMEATLPAWPTVLVVVELWSPDPTLTAPTSRRSRHTEYSPFCHPLSLRDTTTTVILPAALRTRNLLLRRAWYDCADCSDTQYLPASIVPQGATVRNCYFACRSQPTIHAVSCFFALFQLLRHWRRRDSIVALQESTNPQQPNSISVAVAATASDRDVALSCTRNSESLRRPRFKYICIYTENGLLCAIAG